jgi:hypothetical protein
MIPGPDMPIDHIRYDILAQAALRGVVRTVLADAARKGLPGEHHFKITFNTAAPGVRLSDRLRARYPQEMTIVLQYQFWDLTVTEQGFEVGLSFGGIPERVGIPFDAVTAFYDPSVQFGFQFELIPTGDVAESGVKPAERAAGDQARSVDEDKKADALPATPSRFPAAVTREEKEAASPAGAPDAAATPADPADKSGQGAGGEVVRLDRFRKK